MRTASTPRFSWAPRTKQRSRSSGRDASTSSAPVWAEVRAVRVGVARDGTGASTSGSSAHRGPAPSARALRAAAARARRARRLEAPVLGRREQLRLGRARHHRGVRARGDAELGRPPPLAARRAAVGNLRREVGVDVELVHVQPGLALEPRAHLGLAALPAERRAVPAARRVGRAAPPSAAAAARRRRPRGGGDGVEAPSGAAHRAQTENWRRPRGRRRPRPSPRACKAPAGTGNCRAPAAAAPPPAARRRTRAGTPPPRRSSRACRRASACRATCAPRTLRVGRHEHHHAHLVARVLAALRRRAGGACVSVTRKSCCSPLSLRRNCWLAKNVACCGEPPAPAPRHSPAQARFGMIFLNADPAVFGLDVERNSYGRPAVGLRL